MFDVNFKQSCVLSVLFYALSLPHDRLIKKLHIADVKVFLLKWKLSVKMTMKQPVQGLLFGSQIMFN